MGGAILGNPKTRQARKPDGMKPRRHETAETLTRKADRGDLEVISGAINAIKPNEIGIQ
jgi:hypothetical protein